MFWNYKGRDENTPMRTDNRREGPSEFQARRKKGLCFKCEEKYHADHFCKAKEYKELRMLVVRENGEEFEIIEEDGREEVVDENAIEVGVVENLNIEGSTNPRTMKVRGKVKDEDVALIVIKMISGLDTYWANGPD
ncbi:hypothetical protein IC582_026937 [Cucumis melo]